MHVVILAGGAGTRFWPWSRRNRPKQFLPLVGSESMLGQTVDRAIAAAPKATVWIQTRPDLVNQCEALDAVKAGRVRVIPEPEPRDTAPALILATELIAAEDPDAVIAVLPADQAVGPDDVFARDLERAREVAETQGGLVTFGVRPTHPATGYGYVELGEEALNDHVRRVACFREKPDYQTAVEYLESGRHLWNSGMFLWTVPAFRRAIDSADAELGQARAALAGAIERGEDSEAAFRSLPKTSIDYALFEKAEDVWVVLSEFDWDDVGSWRALERHVPLDAQQNCTIGDTITIDSKQTTVVGTGQRTVVVLGCEDLVVVETDDVVFVCPRDRSEDVKQVVETLRSAGHERLL